MTNVSPSLVSVFSGPDRYDDSRAIQSLVVKTLIGLGLPPEFVSSGDRVVIKPNWIKEHDERRPGPDQWEHVITHPAVIEAVVRWVGGRMPGGGAIVICDAPQTDSSFQKIREYCRLDEMLERCRADFPRLRIDLLDLRPEEWHAVDGVTVSKTPLPGDPLGHTQVRLDTASEFVGFSGLGRLYGASFDMAETNEHHHDTIHEYLFCRTPMEADVFINLPKLKTHKKVGLTCALKNLVGINGNKNWLPHHTEGTPKQGGDQFSRHTWRARFERSAVGAAKSKAKGSPLLSRLLVPLKKIGRLFLGDTQKVVRSGNWHGNDTCWRMVLDLNKGLFSFDGNGQRRQKPLRYLAIVDGIIGGEGNGPMAPDPKPCGVILAGTHPVAVDCVAATLMGFDWQKVRLLKNSFAVRELNFTPFTAEEIQVVSNRAEWAGRMAQMFDVFRFRPHFGWAGAVERK